MHLVQFLTESGARRVGVPEADGRFLRVLDGYDTVYALARVAVRDRLTLAEAAQAALGETLVDYDAVIAERRLLAPLDHPEPARFWITGTGLTHLGSADARDKMHLEQNGPEETMTDSMKIFRMGLTGGKPAPGEIGVQPEWFFKGLGTCVVPPEHPLPMPGFALAGGEEAEIVGLYLIDEDGNPRRLGFAMGNEFSDQVTEAINYLYLAHSKLRACSIGPELLLGALPADIHGTVRVLRGDALVWEGEFLSGEDNMSHSIQNLEHYHFRYPSFRRPGDLHAYFFGAPVLSCAHGIKTQDGDRFEIDVPVFGRPLRNAMALVEETTVTVTSL
ncbi:AraD1 family protein [Acidisoma cladoniae]|uniref:AraD1 family protein n=1 Tax=Acidisoma cladoniae TaxID=3040935 RepID=UPI00254D7FC1|nr:AraD1 family protein [Acidisoma sp. PAMC 29798]